MAEHSLKIIRKIAVNPEIEEENKSKKESVINELLFVELEEGKVEDDLEAKSGFIQLSNMLLLPLEFRAIVQDKHQHSV
ncbi:hypothetical protein VNO77_32932 [Canavalia gladiata]|uniref:Uncharacterized protein n=1 Tax=Canavalia gladiata TaxID=3824 RepID=A0AAN9KAT2_CANGL